jgi:carboxymethylenebutenolidase
MSTPATAAATTAAVAPAKAEHKAPPPPNPKLAIPPEVDDVNRVTVTTTNPRGPLPAFYFPAPAAEPSDVAIVVIQEIWGINAQMAGRGRWFAAQGISAIVPHLFRAQKLMDNHADALAFVNSGGFGYREAVDDIKGCIDFLKSKGHTKIFVHGYCLGGGLTVAAAAVYPKDFMGGIAFYGNPKREFVDVSHQLTQHTFFWHAHVVLLLIC